MGKSRDPSFDWFRLGQTKSKSQQNRVMKVQQERKLKASESTFKIKEGRMNIYEMVERIIELTQKGKIEWEKSFGGGATHTGLYKGMRIYIDSKQDIRVNDEKLRIGKEQMNRLVVAVEKSIPRKISEARERKLQEASDILREG